MASALITFISGTLICIVSLFSSIFRRRAEWHFSFLSRYPYEVFSIDKRTNRLPWFFFCLGLLIVSSTSIFLLRKEGGLTFTIGNIAVSLPFLLFSLLTFVSLYYERWHLAFFLLFSLLSMFLAVSYGYHLLTDLLAQQMPNSRVYAIILLIIALIELCLLVNPVLYRYAYMKKEKVEGNVVVRRPKVIWLAFTEWLIFLLDFLAMIFILLAVG